MYKRTQNPWNLSLKLKKGQKSTSKMAAVAILKSNESQTLKITKGYFNTPFKVKTATK